MEESDKTMALKTAYAEIILNTSKEAAARMMLSERKAVRFQQDLSSTKDEALRLLVRLKQMIDAKTIEAEITSSNQQRRIEELEAQLQEAEDIITDLRSELKWVREKLEKGRSNQLQPINVTNSREETTCQTANQEIISNYPPNSGVISINASDKGETELNQRPLNKCGNEVKQSDQLGVSHDSELDMIMTNKKSELYRNGCTQRIRALERKVIDGKLSPSGDVDDQCALGKNNKEGVCLGKVDDTETSVKDETICNVLALKAGNVEVMKKPSVVGMKKLNRACKLRRRRKRPWGKAKATSHKSHLSQLIKPCKSCSVLSRCKTSTDNGNDEDSGAQPCSKTEKIEAVNSAKGLEEHLLQKSSLYSDEIAIIRKGKRNNNVKSLDSIITSSFKPLDQLAKPVQKSDVVSVNVICGEEKLKVSENEAKLKSLPRLDPGLTLIRSNVDPISGSTNLSVSVKALGRSKPAAEKDPESRNEALLVKQENVVVPSNEMNSEMVNVPMVYSDLKCTGTCEKVEESPSKADGNRLVKYTFQRKRKKGSLSDTDENNSPLKRMVDEKENDTQETKISTMVNEPSRGSRRLAQVARQLISLSGKRW